MSWWLLFPFIGALAGWLVMSAALWRIPGILLKRKDSLDRQLSNLVAKELISFDEIEQKLISPSSLQKILPAIEGHIDEFLRHKLGKSIPMLSMFIGDKTINQLKVVFMEELAELFPKVMKNYLEQLQQEIDVDWWNIPGVPDNGHRYHQPSHEI